MGGWFEEIVEAGQLDCPRCCVHCIAGRHFGGGCGAEPLSEGGGLRDQNSIARIRGSFLNADG
jgi:hypothetical protein